MRTQSGTLTAAARSRQRTPYVQIVIEDWARRWTETYRHATVVTERKVAACNGVLDSTKIVRIRQSNVGDGTVCSIQSQVITDVTIATQWSAWTTIATNGAGSTCVAVGKGEGNTLHCYYWDTASPRNIKCLISSNDGTTWPTIETVTTETYPGSVKDVATSGLADCWYVAGSPFRVQHRVRATTWGAARVCGTITDIGTSRGLAVCYDATLNKSPFCLCYQSSGTGTPYKAVINNFRLDPLTYSSNVYTILPAGAASAFLRPAFPGMIKSNDGNIYLTLCEIWTDGTNVHRDNVIWQCFGESSDYNWWGGCMLTDLPVTVECQIPLVELVIAGRTHLYHAGERNVRCSKLYWAGAADCRMTDTEVLAFHIEEAEDIKRGWIDLSNEGNRYRFFGAVGATGEAIKPYAMAFIRAGYVTSAGNEYVELYPLYIETAALIYGPGSLSRLRLHLIGGWRVLEQWHAPYNLAWVSQTALWGLREIFARAAGLSPTNDGDAIWSSVIANYSITGGRRQQSAWRWRDEWLRPDGVPEPIYQVVEATSAKEAVWKMLQLVGGKLRWQSQCRPYLMNLKSQNPATYDYDVGTGGEIEQAVYGISIPGTNRARITANSAAIAEAYADGATAEAAGRLIETHEVRNELANQAVAEENAEGLTDEGRREGKSGSIFIPLVPGLELYDRLAITDARPNFNLAMRRITHLVSDYNTARGLYHQTVTLGGLS